MQRKLFPIACGWWILQLVNPVLNLPKGQVRCFGGNSIHAARQKFFGAT